MLAVSYREVYSPGPVSGPCSCKRIQSRFPLREKAFKTPFTFMLKILIVEIAALEAFVGLVLFPSSLPVTRCFFSAGTVQLFSGSLASSSLDVETSECFRALTRADGMRRRVNVMIFGDNLSHLCCIVACKSMQYPAKWANPPNRLGRLPPIIQEI